MEIVDNLADFLEGEQDSNTLIFKGNFNPLTLGHVGAINIALNEYPDERILVLPRAYTKGSLEVSLNRKVDWIVNSLELVENTDSLIICNDPSARVYDLANTYSERAAILVGDKNEIEAKKAKWRTRFPLIEVRTISGFERFTSSSEAKRVIRLGDFESLKEIVPIYVYNDLMENGHPH